MSSPDPGLCGGCRHAHVTTSGKGSRFWRCERAKDDPRFRKYPPLPVRACPGHDPGEPAAAEPGSGRTSR